MKKILWPLSSRIIECDKPQGTNPKDPNPFDNHDLELLKMRSIGEPFIGVHKEGQRKEPTLNGTKPPIPKMRQNSRFSKKRQNRLFRKRDKTSDFVDENKLL